MNDARAACIAGIGESEYRRWGGFTDRDEFQLGCVAIMAAARDCGLALKDIDGLATFSDPTINPAILQQALGMERLRFSATVWGGRGGAPCGALSLAVAAVQAGHARYVAVFRSLCQGQTRRYGQYYAGRAHTSLTAPFGLLSAPQFLALVLQRYRAVFGFREEDMAEVAMICRDNAMRNPRAVMHGRKLTLEQYLASRMIADPLRLYDCCIETDGACAMIVTTAERARDLTNKPVRVLAASHGGGKDWSTGAMGAHNMPDETYLTGNQRELATELFADAGVSRDSVDSIQIYDHFTGMTFLSLEDFGFCQPGEGPAYVRAGHLRWPNGRMPMNTAGGSLSEAYLHGLNHLNEGVRQLRGESTSQVAGARVCLITGGGGISPSSAAILGV